LIEMLITSDKETPMLKEAYKEALLFYIQKGSEMFHRFPMKLTEDQNGATRAVKVADMAARDLRPMLIKWMEAVEQKPEVRKRLGLNSQPSYSLLEWIRLGIKLKYLPLKIFNGDWIGIKQTEVSYWQTQDCGGGYGVIGCGGYYWEQSTRSGPNTWLSCRGSIKKSRYCSSEQCPASFYITTLPLGISLTRDDRLGDEYCNERWFQVESTNYGPVKYDGKFALKYLDWVTRNGRGKGTYWLSTYYGTSSSSLYTMPCPGKKFGNHDVSNCKNEVFEFTNKVNLPTNLRKNWGFHDCKYCDSDFVSHSFNDYKRTYLRNGDYARIQNNDKPIFSGFIAMELRNEGRHIRHQRRV